MNNLNFAISDYPEVLEWRGYVDAMEHRTDGLYLVDNTDDYYGRHLNEKLNTCQLPDEARMDTGEWKTVIALGAFKKVTLALRDTDRTIQILRNAMRLIDKPEILVNHDDQEIPAYTWIANHHILRSRSNKSLLMEIAFEFDDTAHNGELTAIRMDYLPVVAAKLNMTMIELLEHWATWDSKTKRKNSARATQKGINLAQKFLNEDKPEQANEALRKVTIENEKIQKNIPAMPESMGAEWAGFRERVKKWRGRPILGLETDMKKLTDCLCGLRGLILLGAETNVGKTLLTMQLATQALKKSKDVCVLFISLEMEKDTLYERLGAAASQTTWKGFVTEGTDERLDLAEERLGDIMSRLLVVKADEIKGGVDDILRLKQEWKELTGCSRIFIVMDYLQVWEVPESVSDKFRTDLDADKWRIEAMKQIKKTLESDEALLVISETTKEGSNNQQGKLLPKHIMGAARLAYAPDTLLLWQNLTDREKYQWISTNQCGSPVGRLEPREAGKKDADEITSHAEMLDKKCKEMNCRPGWLEIAKGRDGTRRESIPITAYYDSLLIEEGFFNGCASR